MNEKRPPLPRSPMLMSSGDTALLLIDIQEKLTDLIGGYERMVWNTRRLLDAAKILGVPVLATEQYPKGLGPTKSEIRERLDTVAEKVRFSCGGCPELFDGLLEKGVSNIVVVGIETHVCVLQSVLDLMTAGFNLYVVVDATGARSPVDHRIGLRRIEANGAFLTTAESVMFEWCEEAGTDEFKRISQLAKESPPDKNA